MKIYPNAAVVILLHAIPGVIAAQPLTLEQCIQRALHHNVDVRVAEQGVARSVADIKAASADRLPSVSATLFNFNRSRTGPSVRIQENPTGVVDPVTGQRVVQEEKTLIPAIERNSYSLSTSANYTIYDAGRRSNTRRASRRHLENSELGLTGRRAEVATAIKRNYFGILKALELVEVQQEALHLSEKQLEDAQVRLEVGSGTQVDVLRLQVALDNAQSHLIDAEQGVVLGKAQLNHRMGAEVTAPLEVAELGPDQWQVTVGQESLPALLEKAMRDNPNARGMAVAVVASEFDLQATRAAWYPRLGGNLSYSRNNEVFDRIVQDFDQNYRLNMGLNLTYNVFDGGLRQANIDRARASLETARVIAEQQRRDLALAIQTERLELTRLQKQLRLGERTVKLAEEDLRLAEERYRVGKARLLEVLDAQVGMTEARANLVRTRYDLKIAEAELLRLMGSA
jgi:outer membrane protein